MNKGLFISFEGIDGSGKSTQLNLFYDYLIGNGFDVIKTKEPGGSVLGKKIRGLLLDKKNVNITKETETLLYAADRAQHMEEVILLALKENKIVLSDRFFDSNIAYQAAAGVKIDDIRKANYFLNRTPDITFYLKIPASLAAKRRSKRKNDRIEEKGILFQEKVAKIFDTLSLENKSFITIDNDGSKEEIFEKIKTAFEQFLK